MSATDHKALLDSIRDQRANDALSILNLAEPILTNQVPSPSQPQSNDASTASNNDSSASASTIPSTLTPQTLAADLAHYRDLFSKLRFSYLEQVTKEKYLRSIVGDPPVLVTHDDNVLLEERLAGMKAELKAKKEMNEELVKEMEALAVQLAERYDFVSEGVRQLEVLPVEIEEMETKVQGLREQVRKREEEMEVDEERGVRMDMGLEETRDAVEEGRRRMKEVDEQIAALQAQLPAKIRECEMADGELEELEGRRNEATKLAREVKRNKEEGGRDAMEEEGRWLKGEECVLRGLLGIADEVDVKG